jgi:hypothetical protein
LSQEKAIKLIVAEEYQRPCESISIKNDNKNFSEDVDEEEQKRTKKSFRKL